MTVYADNAATTRMSRTALDAMLPAMEENYGNPSSLHSVGQRAAELLMKSRETVARCLNCQPREIIFTSGGSEADNQALLSAAAIGRRKGKMHIISTAFEHHAILHTLKQLEEEGFSVTLLPVSETGMVTPEAVQAAIRPDTCLVSVMFANNEIGTVEPIAEIGAVCREKGVLFHTDAVQAVGHVPIDLSQLPVDMLSLSAHKFHGPKGVGVLYAKRGTPLHSLICGGAQERGMRAGTENLPAIAGMAAALREAILSHQFAEGEELTLKDTAAQLGVNAYGVYIVEVVKGGPADKAGLQAGDRIVSVDGSEVATQSDLGTLMQNHKAGDTIEITVARGGQMQTVTVTLGEKGADNS